MKLSAHSPPRQVLADSRDGSSSLPGRWCGRGPRVLGPRPADQNVVGGTVAAVLPLAAEFGAARTGSAVIGTPPPRTFSSPANIGSSSRPLDVGGIPIGKTPATRCCPARNEVEM